MNTRHHVAVRVALGRPRPVSSVPRVPAVGSLPPILRWARCMYVYALVCLCGYTRVPPAMPSAPIPGRGGNRRSRGLPAVTLPILCTLAACLFFLIYLCHRWRFGQVASVHKMGTPSPAAVSARSAVITAPGAGLRARKTDYGGV